MALRPGAVVGGYRVVRILGSGGMGTVYLAQNPILPRRDALKVLSSDLSTDTEFRARFEREANLAAGLDHPNIVAVYNRGEEDGQLWIAMQYVDGTDASEEAKKGPTVMTPQRALRIISEVGKGLDHAHRRGLLHRDVKPANFLLSRVEGDEEERVFLTDFGVAKSAEDGQDLTATGTFMATVAYAPPEQLMAGPLDHRADIYSLGCAFYRLLTGQNPYPSTVPAMVMMGHLREPPPRVSAVRPDLPPGLDHVLAKAMAKDPAQRYTTCREFTQDAEAALYGRPVAQAPAASYTTGPSFPTATGHTGELGRPGTDPRVNTGDWGRPGTDPRAQTAQTMYPTDRQITDQRLVRTLRSDARGTRRGRAVLIAAAVLVVAAIAVVSGIFLSSRDDNSPATGGDVLAAVRSENPQFSGKTITALFYTGPKLSAVLGGSDQARFLQNIGFAYSPKYKPVGEEKSPRTLSNSITSGDIDSEVIMVLRTDPQAGNGGLGGLPGALLYNATAKIVVIDDIATIQAFSVWTDQSAERLATSMVPVIAKTVK